MQQSPIEICEDIKFSEAARANRGTQLTWGAPQAQSDCGAVVAHSWGLIRAETWDIYTWFLPGSGVESCFDQQHMSH